MEGFPPNRTMPSTATEVKETYMRNKHPPVQQSFAPVHPCLAYSHRPQAQWDASPCCHPSCTVSWVFSPKHNMTLSPLVSHPSSHAQPLLVQWHTLKAFFHVDRDCWSCHPSWKRLFNIVAEKEAYHLHKPTLFRKRAIIFTLCRDAATCKASVPPTCTNFHVSRFNW